MYSAIETAPEMSRNQSYELVIPRLGNLLVSNRAAIFADASALLWQYFHSLPEPHRSVNLAGFYTMAQNTSRPVLGLT